MSTDLIADIEALHERQGVYAIVDNMDKETLRKFLEFRVACLQEEMDELKEAMAAENGDDVVDALVDIVVFSLGTLDSLLVNVYSAWDAVHRANMQKHPGVKPERPNPLGLPDLIKPKGWEPPSHKDNLGYIADIFGEKEE